MEGIAVFVDSRGGNTRKVADAIAAELGVSAGEFPGTVPDDARVIFLGSGVYGGKPGERMQRFVSLGQFEGKKVALFATSAATKGAETMLSNVAGELARKGATVLGSFHGRGKFLLVNRGHPDGADLDRARSFAREMISRA
ncbi:MAG: flavodoxin family protein [Methanolinea sp.]